MRYWEFLLELTNQVVKKCFYPKEVEIVIVGPNSQEFKIKKLVVVNSRGAYGTIEIFVE